MSARGRWVAGQEDAVETPCAAYFDMCFVCRQRLSGPLLGSAILLARPRHFDLQSWHVHLCASSPQGGVCDRHAHSCSRQRVRRAPPSAGLPAGRAPARYASRERGVMWRVPLVCLIFTRVW